MHHQIIKSTIFFNNYFIHVFAVLPQKPLIHYFYWLLVICLDFTTQTKWQMRCHFPKHGFTGMLIR